MVVRFHFNYIFSLKDRKHLKQFVSVIFNNEKTSASSLNVIFCDDDFLLGINRQFLNHDYYTDIISFNLNENIVPVDGEVYISIDRVKDNALNFKSSFFLELHRVLFHGVLHFCGYNDRSEKDKKVMKDKEDFYLNKYLVSRETKKNVPRETNR